MGGPGAPKADQWPPMQIRNQSLAEGQYLRPLNTPPIWGLSAIATAQAVRAFPSPRQAMSNDNTCATIRQREISGISCDLSVSLGEVLGTFRKNIEGALKEFERDMQLLASPRSLTCSAKTFGANATMDANSEEAWEEEKEEKEQNSEQVLDVDKERHACMQLQSIPDVHEVSSLPNLVNKVWEEDAEEVLEVDKERKARVQFQSIPDMHGVSSLPSLVNKDTFPNHISARQQEKNAAERVQVALSSTRATAYQTSRVDKCVLDLISELPQNPNADELSKIQFNAGQLHSPAKILKPLRSVFTQDSRWRKFANSKRYSIVRGVAVMVDAALVILETWLSTEAVASRNVVPRLQAFLYPCLITCAFFIFDVFLGVALELPHFNVFMGQAGLRSLDLVATLQQTLVIIGMLSFPGQRFTSLFRTVIHQLSFLRVLRALVILSGMGGMSLQQSVGELYIMMHTLASTVRPLAWCTLMCGCILTVFGMLIAESTATRISRHFPATEVFSEESAQALLLSDWGGTSRCVYSLLMAMLGGTDWGYLLETLIGFGDATFSMICFFVFICFTFIAFFSMITAVLIQCAFMRLEKDRVFATHQELQQKRAYLLAAKEAFEKMTGDCHGRVQREDIMFYLQDPEAGAAFQRLHLDTDQVEKLFLLVGSNGTDGITLQEFMTGCLQLRGTASSLHLELLHQDLKLASRTLADVMMLLQNHTPYFGSEPPSPRQEAQRFGFVQPDLSLFSDQLSELDITVQEFGGG